jgi:hypothetical protein
MGTSNFYNVNASKVFVVLEPYKLPILDENFNETGEFETIECSEFDLERLVDSITNDMKDLSGDLSYHFDHIGSLKELCSFPSSYLGSLKKEKVFNNVKICIDIHAFLRAGYYSSANLDWECYLSIDNNKEISIGEYDGNINDIYFISNDKELIISIDNWIKETKSSAIEKIESVFEKNSSKQLTIFTHFSNGETLYQQIEK